MIVVMDMFFDDTAEIDFGSINMVEVRQRNVRNYTLNAVDKGKLSKITNAGSGSLAYCTDTGELLIYNEADKVWHEV